MRALKTIPVPIAHPAIGRNEILNAMTFAALTNNRLARTTVLANLLFVKAPN